MIITDETPISFLNVGQLKELLKESLLSSLVQYEATREEHSDIPEIMGKSECCRLTGFKPSTISKYMNERSIPYYKSGKKVLFKKSEVLEWLLSNRIQTTEEFVKEKLGK